jgi:hypothetical protein
MNKNDELVEDNNESACSQYLFQELHNNKKTMFYKYMWQSYVFRPTVAVFREVVMKGKSRSKHVGVSCTYKLL